jgi:hypothetical protein
MTKERPLSNPRPTTDKQPHSTRQPNYISQDEEDEDAVTPSQKHQTRSHTRSILEEAMLSCMDAYQPTHQVSEELGLLNFAAILQSKPTFKVTPKQMSMQRLTMQWLCKMANLVIRDNGELLEWRHLTTNPKTRATWTHSYRNEISHLAQGMPGCNIGTNTIFFIIKDQVPKDRAKDVTYGLTTCLVQPEKIDKPNRTRLVADGNRVHYPNNAMWDTK